MFWDIRGIQSMLFVQSDWNFKLSMIMDTCVSRVQDIQDLAVHVWFSTKRLFQINVFNLCLK
jgi:hypothetical protein